MDLSSSPPNSRQGDNTHSPDASTSNRPHFSSRITADRLREGTGTMKRQQLPFRTGGKFHKGRKSIFKEVGLDDGFERDEPATSPLQRANTDKTDYSIEDEKRFGEITGLRSFSISSEKDIKDKSNSDNKPRQRKRQVSLPSKPWFSKMGNPMSRPRVKGASGAPPSTGSAFQRFTLIALLIAIVLPTFRYRRDNSVVGSGVVDAGVVLGRAKTSTQVCTRWAQQVAFLNGTLYMYGGEATTSQGQTENTWNNDFLTLDLTKDWSKSSPPLTGLTIPDGPPAVAMGYLWHDYNNLYLYGGEFSTSPYVDPAPQSIWKYAISDATWSEIQNPETSGGNYSEGGGMPVNRAAEGAGISVPELGLSWYFGGHLDWATVPDWSRDIDRVYLQSLLEFTHPGYVNSGVYALADGTGAGSDGAFRNITQGGIQATDFPERADGALVFVPGWGTSGILIGLAGGTWSTFTPDLSTLDVYDIASSQWYHQQTSGETPGVRVNPCAVVASAPDASSFQIYMFGGQDLQPAGDQTQYNDMYILTIPSFTWIKVDQSDQDIPSPRAGHTCTMQDGQMIVVGGYVGADAACDSPGVYVFNASALRWEDSFTAGDHSAGFDADNSVLAGSYGYTVPDAVQSVIGGNNDGSATATKPVSSATGGPFATGHAPVFTITDSGSTATVTAGGPTSTGSSSGSGSGDSHSNSSSKDEAAHAGLISAGVVAGIAGALALYLGFCAWLYRRQVRAYRRHLAVANRYSGASGGSFLDPATAALVGRRSDRAPSQHSDNSQAFGSWIGSDMEPAWLADSRIQSSDDPSPFTHPSASGSGSGSGSGGLVGPMGGMGGYGAQAEKYGHLDDTQYHGAAHTATDDDDESTSGLLEGQEPSFFSVVMGPRRALRVVNGID